MHNELFLFLQNTAQNLTLHADTHNINQCLLFAEDLLRWNKHTNLVGKTSLKNLVQELIVDSLHIAHILSFLPIQNPSIFDLGAGAGIPGVPLRCFWKNGSYTLVEVREKRVLFLQYILAKLQLQNTFVLPQDAHLACEKNSYDILLSRAFMPPLDFCSLCSKHFSVSQKNPLFTLLMLNTPLHILPKSFTIFKEHSYTVSQKKRILLLLQYTNSV